MVEILEIKMSYDNKKLVPLSAVPGIIAELTGVQRVRATVYNWTKNGCRTLDGRMVRLKVTMRMRQAFTTRDDIIKFIESVG